MKSGLNFLIAAKRCEIAELQQLSLTSALVNVTGRLIHGLQRERGLSNLFLASQGEQFAGPRCEQVAECEKLDAELRACFDTLDTEPARMGNGARLFSRIAYVLQGLDALPGLRERIHARGWSPRRTTDAYVRLIAGLLGVVFEAADSATDPEVSRQLVAMFNFMQAKEFAGQERATGAGLFAAGRAHFAEQQRLLHLIESQERCLQVFNEFAGAQATALDADGRAAPNLAELERLRRILCTAPDGGTLDAQLSQTWFDCCSRRMDRMKAVEDGLAGELVQVCQHKVAAATADLSRYEALDAAATRETDALSFFQEAPPTPVATTVGAGMPGLPTPAQGYGLHLERSILELVQEQARRLQAMGDELETVRASLNERKVIERAKGLLMAHRHLSEEEAHKTMRQMAMNQNRRLIEVAEGVLAMAEVLPARRP
ncbi:MAG: nitrate- and nitrite sensing domain-containing protein [Ramlibacter sp.]|nr:nitrate- and nitrite sensing domain-containing protein [Ramlibacter sp.]